MIMSSKSTSSTFHMEAQALSPVRATITSYGRSSKLSHEQIARSTTLYVIHVTHNGREWYVARRYSAFRRLHEALVRATTPLASTTSKSRADESCECEELVRLLAAVQFPKRHALLSALWFTKQKLDATRVSQLNGYLQALLRCSQGLLDEECESIALIREFLLVPSCDSLFRRLFNSEEDEEEVPQSCSEEEEEDNQEEKPRLPQMDSSAGLKLDQMDVFYRENPALSCGGATSGKASGSGSCTGGGFLKHSSSNLTSLSSSPLDGELAFVDGFEEDDLFDDFRPPRQDDVLVHRHASDLGLESSSSGGSASASSSKPWSSFHAALRSKRSSGMRRSASQPNRMNHQV